MLLRRITEHVKAQNWTAVALDFVIVVVGVFIGLQVANWNASISQNRVLESRIAALHSDMQENLTRLDEYGDEVNSDAGAVSSLRALLGSDAPSEHAAEIDEQYLKSFGLPVFTLQMSAFEDLKASGDLLLLADSPARMAIADWEAALADLMRLENDLLEIRNRFLHTYLVDNHSFAAATENFDLSAEFLAPTRFRNDPDAMAQDRRLDNVLAIMILIRGDILNEVEDLRGSTRRLIETIEAT